MIYAVQVVAGGYHFDSPSITHFLGNSGYPETPVLEYQEEDHMVPGSGDVALPGSDLLHHLCASSYPTGGNSITKKEVHLTHARYRKETRKIMAH